MIDKAFDKLFEKSYYDKPIGYATQKELAYKFWKQSRIDTLGEIKKKIKIRLKGVKSMIISEWVYEVIDTELKKGGESRLELSRDYTNFEEEIE